MLLNLSAFLAVNLLVLPNLSRSFKAPIASNFFCRKVTYRAQDIVSSSIGQQRKSSVAVLAYSEISELNEAIKKNSSMAYELFTKQKGIINYETAYLTLAALTQQGIYM